MKQQVFLGRIGTRRISWRNTEFFGHKGARRNTMRNTKKSDGVSSFLGSRGNYRKK